MHTHTHIYNYIHASIKKKKSLKVDGMVRTFLCLHLVVIYVFIKYNRRIMNKIRKDIIKLFKKIEFHVEIKTNLREVDFQGVTFNFERGVFLPFRNQNNVPLYTHIFPPSVIIFLYNFYSFKKKKYI